jgi:hypothetical protein
MKCSKPRSNREVQDIQDTAKLHENRFNWYQKKVIDMPSVKTKEDVMQVLRDEMPLLQERYGITRIALFGSFAQGNPQDDSEVDIVVETSQPLGLRFFELSDYLAGRLGRMIDLVTFNMLKVAGKKPEKLLRHLVYI